MKRKLFYLFVIILIGFILSQAQAVMTYTKDAVIMCYEFIIPSLFPFFVCSGLLMYSGFGTYIARLCEGIMRPLFNVAPSGAAAFVTGIISGFPMGAFCAKELYRCGNLSKAEAERLLAFCNNSGPLFIVGTIGVAIYGKPSYGVMLYVIHIISSILVGIAFRSYGKSHHNSPKTEVMTREMTLTEVFSISLNNASKNIINVCFSIIFFSAISRAVLSLIPMNTVFDAVVSGVCEFSTGVMKISALGYGVCEKLVLTSLVVGFSGICVHLQVMAVTSGAGLSLTPYILGKCLHSITAAVLTAAVLLISPSVSHMFTPNVHVLSASFCVSAAMLTVGCITAVAVGVTVKRRSLARKHFPDLAG